MVPPTFVLMDYGFTWAKGAQVYCMYNKSLSKSVPKVLQFIHCVPKPEFNLLFLRKKSENEMCSFTYSVSADVYASITVE